jgi:hypothetical protein
MENTLTGKQASAAFSIVAAVAEAIRELKSVPSGTLYAQLCGKFDIHQYEAIIRTLVNADLVKQTPAHELIWIGPRF